MDVTSASGAKREFVLEETGRLSESMIWSKIKIFYEAHGHQAFSKGSVPHFVTTNAHIARSYAKVMLGFLQDCAASGQIDPEEPVYLVELGAGSGRLGYRVFLELRAMAAATLPGLALKLILTDLGVANRKFWRNHFRLAPLFEEGVVDVARFNIETDREMHLEVSGTVLRPGEVRNPAIVMANYLFDSIPIDLFWVDEEGRLYESLVKVSSSVESPNWKEHNIWRHLGIEFYRRPLTGPAYPDAMRNAVLDACAARIRGGVVAFPVACFQCLDNVGELFGQRYFLMTSDKGYHHAEFVPRTEILFSMDGSLSSDVNYHCLEMRFAQSGGRSFVTQFVNKRLDTCGFAQMGGMPMPRTALAFGDAIESFAPYDFLQVALSMEPDDPITVQEYLAFLRLANYDGHVAARHAEQVIPQIPGSGAELRHQLLLAIDKVWAGYFSLGEDEDVPLALGRMMIALAYWEPAVELLLASVGIYGERELNTYHLAICCLQLGDLDRAEELAEKAAAFNPGEESYRQLLATIADRRKEED